MKLTGELKKYLSKRLDANVQKLKTPDTPWEATLLLRGQILEIENILGLPARQEQRKEVSIAARPKPDL